MKHLVASNGKTERHLEIVGYGSAQGQAHAQVPKRQIKQIFRGLPHNWNSNSSGAGAKTLKS